MYRLEVYHPKQATCVICALSVAKVSVVCLSDGSVSIGELSTSRWRTHTHTHTYTHTQYVTLSKQDRICALWWCRDLTSLAVEFSVWCRLMVWVCPWRRLWFCELAGEWRVKKPRGGIQELCLYDLKTSACFYIRFRAGNWNICDKCIFIHLRFI